jgi:hypothetical protein
MSVKSTILSTQPTSYWPLDDLNGFSCHDEMSLHEAFLPKKGLTLAAIPFGASRPPFLTAVWEAICRSMVIHNIPNPMQMR